MYGMKPIIREIVGQLHTEYENGVLRAVKGVGFDVDKERLTQALKDAEKFYMEGYTDAMTNHDVVKVVRCKDCESLYEDARLARHCVLTGHCVCPDDFCSYGERRSAHGTKSH